MRLNFQTFGAGFPLLILHGLFGSLDNWQSVARQLSADFQVFTIDLRNHGRSPHDSVMSYEAMSADIAEFAEFHGLERIHLLGHSLGGKVAMRFALDQPARVAKLVVADMAPKAYPPAHLEIFEALRSLNLAGFEQRNEIDAALAPAIPGAPVRQFLLKNLARTDGGGFTWKLNLAAIEAGYPALLEAVDGAAPFPGPVLFICGERSDYVTAADRDLIPRLFPNAAFHTIPRAGHWLHADAPAQFTEAVAAFLKAAAVVR